MLNIILNVYCGNTVQICSYYVMHYVIPATTGTGLIYQ